MYVLLLQLICFVMLYIPSLHWDFRHIWPFSKEGKQTNNYWNRKNIQKVHLLSAYLLSNVFNESLLFLALLVFQPESFILWEIKITNLSSQKKSSTIWEDDQSIKYLDYLFLLFLFGFFRRLIRCLLLRRHDGGQADFPANCACKLCPFYPELFAKSRRKNGGKIAVLCPGPLGCGHLKNHGAGPGKIAWYKAESSGSPKNKIISTTTKS